MSRSTRKAIIKDRPRNNKKSTLYWRKIRRIINSKVRNNIDDNVIPVPKEIVNDYDYCDYIMDYEHIYEKNEKNNEYTKKLRRK